MNALDVYSELYNVSLFSLIFIILGCIMVSMIGILGPKKPNMEISV